MEGNLVNQEKSGDTYVVLYKQLPVGTDSSHRKRSHMAVVVDVEGKSTESILYGEQFRISTHIFIHVYLDLCANTATRATKFLQSYIERRERSTFYDVVYLGKLGNPYGEPPSRYQFLTHTRLSNHT